MAEGFRRLGWFAVRSAGSHGVADVVVIKVTPANDTVIYLIQCKSGRSPESKGFEELERVAISINAYPLVCLKRGRESMEWFEVEGGEAMPTDGDWDF